MFKLKTTLLLLFFSVSQLAAQVTTEGKDFWFGFMENDNASGIELYLSSRTGASVNISAPLAGFTLDVEVQPNVTGRVDLPLSLMPTTEGVHGMGIHVTSDKDITVYTLNKRRFSADAAVILPTNVLGQEYFVIAHVEPPGDRVAGSLEAELLIVATEDNTEIEYTPSAATHGGLAAGQIQTITLNAGETLQLKSEGDLSGTYVRNISPAGAGSTCKKIAVFGGNKFTNVGGCGGNRDHLLEQMFPISTWGKEFLFVPYQTRNGGDFLKIIAAEDNTTVSISGQTDFTLNRGEVFINKALDGIRTISSDKPMEVAQFSRSTQCDGVVNSDPFMIMLSPSEQRVKQATFSAFNVQQISQYYLTLITVSDAADDIMLDGVNVSDKFFPQLDLKYAELEISAGSHTITASDGVIAYVYGYGPSESFGYSAGASLENLNLDIEGEDMQLGIVAQQGCEDSPITFDALFETPAGEQPRFDTFNWDFGDGGTAEGKEVNYTFVDPGTYTITLTASKGAGACSNFEVTTREFEMTEVGSGDIVGPVSVCPDVEGVEYSVTGSTENTYKWVVFGGVIDGSDAGLSVKVDWSAARDDAWLKLAVTNPIGCAADTLQYDVKINKRLEPIDPQGAAEVCFLDFGSVTYTTPQTAGSEYEWFVTNGTILNGNAQNSVDIQWDGVGAGEVWYREFNPNISDCEGFSDKLAVTIYSEIIPTEVINDALCNGDANGSITLSVSGGKGSNYTALWSNGDTALSPVGLASGTYTVTIADELGCEIQREYVVGHPDVLEVTSAPEVLDVRCFQESNGEVLLTVQGGTAPYSYHHVGNDNAVDRTSSDARMTGLPTGNYSVEITDANGCITSANYFVAQPALLEPDLEKLINLPICPQASDGTVSIDALGGTQPYQFFWNTSPQQQGIEATGLSEGMYTVTIIDANGCEASLDVDVKERFPRVFIPNAFSPNGDGENDKFMAVTDCNLVYSMQVFNKWGSVIFATNDILDGWDATLEGQNVPDGVYSYKVFYSGTLNGVPFEETIQGTVRVFR